MSRKQNFRFYDHDDRGSTSNHNIRKVSFKHNHGRIQKSRKGDKSREKFFVKLKTDDDDVDMGGCDVQGFRVGKRRNFKGRARSPDLRQSISGQCDWYKIKIMYGCKYEKSNLLQLLLKYIAPQVFVPVSYSVIGSHAYFYIDDVKAAQALEQANRKILLPDGHKMIIRIMEGQPPQIPVNNEVKEKLKIVMAKRYIAENKALDLSKLVKDPEFPPGMYCPLSRPAVLRAVLQIISENIPDLYALDLTGNRIHMIDGGPSTEFQKLKNLKILHLADNNIKTFSALNGLKGVELNELVLKDNPIVRAFSDHTHFVRYDSTITEVRKRFPKLLKLDNAELPPVVSFDVEESKLPTPQASFICNQDGRGIVREFLSQYFLLYDSDKRRDLVQAYHEKAYFSQCSFYCPSQNSNTTNHRLGSYIQESRNLLKIPYILKRRSKLHIGKENVVSFLETLPKTQHDLSSFVVDLSIFTPTLIDLSVCGVFREPDTSSSEASWPVRHFSRTFLIVPVGQGFCIVNDSLFITNATDEEKAAFFKTETQNSAILQSPPTAQPTALAPAVPLDDSVRLQMVQTLSAQSGMNIEWSKKCLDETQWNFDRAVWTFTELQKQGAIPQEAFVKGHSFTAII